jgi:hypothetical protein
MSDRLKVYKAALMKMAEPNFKDNGLCALLIDTVLEVRVSPICGASGVGLNNVMQVFPEVRKRQPLSYLFKSRYRHWWKTYGEGTEKRRNVLRKATKDCEKRLSAQIVRLSIETQRLKSQSNT